MRGPAALLLVALVSVGVLGVPSTADAAPQASVKPTSGPTGTTVEVNASGFTDGFACRVEFEMTPGVSTSRVVVVSQKACDVTPNGTLTESFTVPAGAKEGSSANRVWVCNYCDQGEFTEVATAAFTVTAPSEPSPSPSPTASSDPDPDPEPDPTSDPDPDPDPTTSPSARTSPSPSAGVSPSPDGEGSPSPSPSPSPTLDAGERIQIAPMATMREFEAADLFPGLPPVRRPTSLGGIVLSGITLDDLRPVAHIDPVRFLFPLDRCAEPSGATRITFDDLVWNDGVDEQYRDQGVRFASSPAGILRIRDAAVGSISPPQVLANINTTTIGSGSRRFELDTARGDVGVFFDELQTDVGAYVGLVGDAPYRTTATMTATDAAGEVIGTDSTAFGPGPVAVDNCLRVRQPTGDTAAIASVSISYDPPLPEALDDLFFASALPQPDARELGAVRFTRPVDGSTMTDRSPSFAGEVFGTAPVESVEVQWQCSVPRDPDSSYWSSLAWGRITAEVHPDPANPLRSVWVTPPRYLSTSPCGSEVELELSVTARYEGGGLMRDEITVTYVSPAVVEDGAPVEIAAVEPTQGLRIDPLPVGASTTSVTDPMTHVADRPMVLRVHPRLVDGGSFGSRSDQVYARAVAFRGGRFIPGTETLPENDPVYLWEGMTSIDAQRRDASGTWNFRLPREWTQPGTTRVVLTAYPEGVTPGAYDACRCGEPPHTVHLDLTFAAGGEIEMHMFAVHHTFEAADGSTVVNPFPTLGALGDVIDQAYRYLPLSPGAFWIADFQTMRWEGVLSFEDDEGNDQYPFFDAMRLAHLVPAGIEEADPAHRGTMFGFYFDGTRGCGGTGWLDQAFFNSGACNWASVPTHEALHTLGLAHASNRHNEAGGGGFDASFPGTCGQMSYAGDGTLDARTFGVDVHAASMRVIVPDSPGGDATPGEDGTCADRHVHDLLSYGWGQDWISPYTWQNVVERLGGPTVRVAAVEEPSDADVDGRGAAAGGTGGDHLVVLLHVGEDDVELRGSVLADVDVPDQPSHVHVRALDADGAVVVEHPTSLLSPESGGPAHTGSVLAVLPTSGWSVLEVVRDGEVVGSVDAPGAATSVSLEQPTPGTVVGTEPTTVAWSTPLDGASALVQVSSDDGATWRTVASTDETSTELDASQVGTDAGEALLRVQVHAGAAAAVSEPVAIEVGDAAPMVVLLAPRDRAMVPSGEIVRLVGQARTAGGSAVGEADLQWAVDGTPIGSGSSWVAPDLADGSHELTLTATVGGITATDSVTIEVGTDSDRDGILDAVEQRLGLDPDDPTDAGSDTDGDGLGVLTELDEGTDPALADTDGDHYGDQVELMAGSDPTDPESLPGPSHRWDGEWPRVRAESQAGGVSRALVLAAVAGLVGFVGGLMLWRRRVAGEVEA